MIYNGFDTEDFKGKANSKKGISIAHFGTFPQTRNHSKLWDALDKWANTPEKMNLLSFDFYGYVYDDFEHELNRFAVSDCASIIKSIPHKEATLKMLEYTFLYLSLSDTSLSEGRIPLKFYEYLATGTKIIATGKKNTDLSKLITELDCGYYINYGEEDKLIEILNKQLNPSTDTISTAKIEVNKFSKEEQAKEYVELFNQATQ